MLGKGMLMKLKTIDKAIKSKMLEWLDTVPIAIREDVQNNIIITGGCIASMLLKEPVNDYDLYFMNKKPLVDLVTHYVRDLKGVTFGDIFDQDHKQIEEPNRVRIKIESAGVAQFEKPEEEGEYKVIFLTENAVTLSDKVQIVTRFIGSPAVIHGSYDFIHATNYWTFKEDLVLNERALSSLLTRELFYSGSKYPLCSIIRTRKFIKRGFTINAGQYLKMALQLNELNLMDVEVLRDQLVGVDSAYFDAFIKCLEAKISNDGMEAITNVYLFNLVDFIFDRAESLEERDDSESE